MNQFQMFDHLNPPKVDKPGYVTRGKNKIRASNSNSQPMSKSQTMMKKGQSWGQNPKNDDDPILLALEAIPLAWEASLEA
jgi:hypothetical protein